MKMFPKRAKPSHLLPPGPKASGTSPDATDLDDVKAVLLGADALAKSFLYLLRSATDLIACLRLVEVRHWPRLLCLVEDERLRAEVRARLKVPRLVCCS